MAKNYLKYMKYMNFCILCILCIHLISAQNLECSLNEHFYSNSNEIRVYNNETSFDGISLEIVSQNKLNDSRILNISITNSSPSSFSSALPSIPENLRILQTKTLWVSKIIDTKQFTDGEIINFTIELSGNIENSEEINCSTSKEILIRTEENGGFIYSFGKVVMPSNPIIGTIFFLFLIFAVLYVLWRFDIYKRIQNYKLNKIRKRNLKKNIEDV